MEINNKIQSYQLLQQGLLGNHLRYWDGVEEIRKDGYDGKVTVRYKSNCGGGGFVRYDVDVCDIERVLMELENGGAKRELIYFNEIAPDDKLLFQGEVVECPKLELFYSTEKKKMRDALRDGKSATWLEAKTILEHYLDENSLCDFRELLEKFPGHAIEFSTYGICLGNLPARNTVIWEVRKY